MPNRRRGTRIPLVDPDPASLFLAWLGAVGSIASIAAWYEQRKDKKEIARQAVAREEAYSDLISYLSEIESAYGLLHAQLEKLNLLFRLVGDGQFNFDPMLVTRGNNPSPFRFGAAALNLPSRERREFVRIHLKVITLSREINKSVYGLLMLLSRYRFDLRPETFHVLVEFRSRLNDVLEKSPGYRASIESCLDVATYGRNAVDLLRRDFAG